MRARWLAVILFPVYIVFAASADMRIVSLAPSMTEIVVSLGRGDALVGRTEQCKAAPAVPRIGTVMMPSAEAIVRAKPAIVLATDTTRKDSLDRLRALKLTVHAFPVPVTFHDICGQCTATGKLLGREMQAEEIIRAASARVAKIRSRPLRHAPRVFIQIGTDPLYAAGPKSYLHQFLVCAGASSIVRTGEYVQYSREMVLRENPDIIILVTMEYAADREKHLWERYGSMKAVRRKQIYIVDSYTLCIPTPDRFADGAALIASLVDGSGDNPKP